MIKRSLPLLALLLLLGCQPLPRLTPPTAETTSAQSVAQQAPEWLPELRSRAATLPAAQATAEEEGLTIAYPGSALFAVGAVLPLPGGAEVLDPLSDLLAAFPAARWNGTVQAATTYGPEYDSALAAKRAELLQRYLTNRGVATAAVAWKSGAGAGAPLTLVLETTQWRKGSSSGVKE